MGERLVSQLFPSILGQPLALSLLSRAIASHSLAPAYLFTGEAGIGKATTAKAFCQILLECDRLDPHPDCLWVEPTYLQQEQLIPVSMALQQGLSCRQSPQIRIEQIREVNQFLSLSSQRKVVVVESAEFMLPGAANAFLKTLEEPGNRTTIILTTNHSERLLPTLLSRCQVIPFLPLSQENLRQVLSQRGNGDMAEAIVAMAQGSPGQAIALWNSLKSLQSSILNPRISKLSEALSLAREVGSLPLETQLLVADYWQVYGWQHRHREWVERLEALKQQLLKASPQLVWEVALIAQSRCDNLVIKM
jgi:DNA polymerase-3 subunit delta'